MSKRSSAKPRKSSTAPKGAVPRLEALHSAQFLPQFSVEALSSVERRLSPAAFVPEKAHQKKANQRTLAKPVILHAPPSEPVARRKVAVTPLPPWAVISRDLLPTSALAPQVQAGLQDALPGFASPKQVQNLPLFVPLVKPFSETSPAVTPVSESPEAPIVLQWPRLRAVVLLGLMALTNLVGTLGILPAKRPLHSITEQQALAYLPTVTAATPISRVFPLTASERAVYQNSVAAMPQMIQPQAGAQFSQKKLSSTKKQVFRAIRPARATFSGLMTPMSRFTFSSPFGMRRGRMHQGVDFAAPVGTPIYAAAEGVVLSAGWDGGYGKSILVAHAGNVVTRYAHCSTMHVRKGQRVMQGQRIANVGNTGSSTGAHLHLEVIEAGRHRNPVVRLKPFSPVVAGQAAGASKSG